MTRGPNRLASRCAAALGAIVLALVEFQFAQATSVSPTVVIGSINVAPSSSLQTALLDVLIDAPSGFSLDVAGFQLGLAIEGPDDAVKFVSAGPPLGMPYLFAPGSTTPFATISPDGSRMKIGDFLLAEFGRASSETGLASVQVSILPAAAGNTYLVVADPDPAESYLGISSTNLLPVAASGGVISVAPEPSGAALTSVVLAAAFATNRNGWRRRRSLAS